MAITITAIGIIHLPSPTDANDNGYPHSFAGKSLPAARGRYVRDPSPLAGNRTSRSACEPHPRGRVRCRGWYRVCAFVHRVTGRSGNWNSRYNMKEGISPHHLQTRLGDIQCLADDVAVFLLDWKGDRNGTVVCIAIRRGSGNPAGRLTGMPPRSTIIALNQGWNSVPMAARHELLLKKRPMQYASAIAKTDGQRCYCDTKKPPAKTPFFTMR